MRKLRKEKTRRARKPEKGGAGAVVADMRQIEQFKTLVADRDKTARKLTKRMHQQEVVSYLSQVALATTDFDGFLGEAVAFIARTLDVELASVLELDEAGKRLSYKTGIGWDGSVRSGKISFDVKASLGGLALTSKRPIVVRNFKESKYVPLPHLRRHKVQSSVSVVIPGVARPYGVIGVYSRNARDYSDDDVNFLQSIANVIALSFERSLTEKELRRFQYMADSANVGISLIDKEGRFKYVNKVSYERLGFSRDEYLKKRVVHKASKGSESRFPELFRRSQRGGVPPVETFEMRKDGKSSVPLEINLTGVEFEGEQLLFAVSQDITERIRARKNLEFLAEASLMLNSSLDYRKTLEYVARIAATHIADWCAIYIKGEDGKLEAAALAACDEKELQRFGRFRKARRVDAVPEFGPVHVVRTGKPELYPSVDEETIRRSSSSERDRKLIRNMGFGSVLVVPISRGKTVLGAIQLVTMKATRRPYDRNDLAIVQELAGRIELAVEQAELYQRLESQKDKLDDIIAHIPGVVWENWFKPNPAEHKVNYMSDYVEKLYGYPKSDWEKRGFWKNIVHPEDRELARELNRQLVAEGKDMVHRFRWIHKEGRVIWCETHVSAIKDRRGQVIGIRGVTTDVTERLELERRKDEFISMASHELKTPVTTLKVYTQILQRQAESSGNGAMHSYLTKMDSQISRLTDLINDLLDLSKIQTGKLTFKLSDFDLDELVREVVEQMQPTSSHSIRVTGKLHRPVRGDRDRIGQVVINILSNAIKYSPNADKIAIALSADRKNAYVAVRDFGIGIPKAQQKKIFTRFYQATDGDKKTYPGLGIGLYISEEIMRRHGGDIRVSSAEGKGSTFTVIIPFDSRAIEAALTTNVHE